MFIWNSVYFRKAKEMKQSINYLKCLALILSGLRYTLNFTAVSKPEPSSQRLSLWSVWKRRCTNRWFCPKAHSRPGHVGRVVGASEAEFTLGCSGHGSSHPGGAPELSHVHWWPWGPEPDSGCGGGLTSAWGWVPMGCTPGWLSHGTGTEPQVAPRPFQQGCRILVYEFRKRSYNTYKNIIHI